MQNPLLLGSASIGAVEAVQHLPVENTAGLVIQIVIGLITIAKMIWKPKEKSTNSKEQK